MLRLVLIASTGLAARAATRNTQASNTVVVERIPMPGNFFEMMSNFTSNDAAPNGTTSRKLQDKDRRLASAYCSDAFTDMAGAYVMLGDTETAGQTDTESDPGVNFGDYVDTIGTHLEFYLVHSDAGLGAAGIATANELCAEMVYNLDAININPDKTDIDIGSTGATCKGCFAQGGAKAVVGMHCYTDEDGVNVCDVSASLGGSFEYDVDVLLKDPSITATSTEPIWNGDSIELARFGETGLSLVLDVTPNLHATVGGTLQATGELSAKASASGNLEIGGTISEGTFTASQTSSLDFDPLTFTATGFDVEEEEAVEIVVTPEFLVGMTVQAVITTGISPATVTTTYDLFATKTSLQTPISITTSSADCDTNYKTQSYAQLSELGSPVLGYSADLSEYEAVSVDISDDTISGKCLTNPDGGSGAADEVATVDVSLSLEMSGITCEDYGTPEAAAVNVVLAELIEGADAETFTDHECASGTTTVVTTRRRALLSNAITISTSVTVATDTYASKSASDIATSVTAVLNEAVSSGAFTSSVQSSGVSTLASVSVTSSTATAADTSIASRTAASSFFAAVSLILASATVVAMF